MTGQQSGLDELIDQAVEVARLQQVPDADEMARRVDALRDNAETLALLKATSLCAPEVRACAREVAPREVANVLDRMAADDPPMRAADHPNLEAEQPSGPGADWERELRRLWGESERSAAWLLGQLAARGFPVQASTVTEMLAGRLIPDDVNLVSATVEVLGGNWVIGGYQSLFDAALREREGNGDVAPRAALPTISGLSGADPMDPEDSVARVAAPKHQVPTLYGRRELVGRLSERLRHPDCPTQVLIGEAGYGKSTIALAVAHQAQSDLLTLWVPAPDIDALADGLRRAALGLGATIRELNVAIHANTGLEHVQQLWRLLDTAPRRWLLVLDDAGPTAVGHPAWVRRSPAGRILVTSRFGDPAGWGPDAQVSRIGDLDPENGGRVVLDRIGLQGTTIESGMETQARELSRRLNGMPLALLTAGNLVGCGIGGHTLGQLLDAIGTGAQAGPSELGGAAGLGPLEATYEISLRAIIGAGRPVARDLLRVLACFAPGEQVPDGLLNVRHLPPGATDGWESAKADLIRVGLVEEIVFGINAQRCLRVHPAVAEQARRDRHYDRTRSRLIHTQAVQLLLRETMRLDPEVPGDWSQLRMLYPHAEELLDGLDSDGDDLDQALRLAEVLDMASRLSIGLMKAGEHITAPGLLDRAIDRTAVLGPDHPARLEARQSRAWMAAMRGDGDLAMAEDLVRAVLADKIRLFGRQDPRTLAARDCLAWLLAEQGALSRALVRFTSVLTERAMVLGPQHPETLATRHRLAWVTALCGRQTDAESELRAVHDLRLQVLGSSDRMDLYNTRYRLAWVLTLRGRLDEARRLYESLRRDVEEVVGATHPMTLIVRVRLAWVMAWQNQFDEAENAYRDVLTDQEKVLGIDHPRVLRTKHLMACLSMQRGRLLEAQLELRAVARARARVLGPDHHSTIETRSYLAWTLLQAGRCADADREFRAVLADRRRTLGARHPVTLLTRYLLARVLTRRGQLPAAEDQLRQLLADAVGVLEPDSRLMLEIRHGLAFTAGLQGHLGACEAQLKSVLDTRTRVLGPEHRDTLATRDYLSWVLGVRGRLPDALDTCGRTLADRTRLLGAEHPHTLLSRYRMAWLLTLAGQRETAMEQFVDLRDVLAETLAAQHPESLRCRAAIVWLLRLDGKLEEAEQLGRELIDDQTRILGANEVDTMRSLDGLGLIFLQQGRTESAATVFSDVLRRRRRRLGHRHPDTLVAREHLARAHARLGHPRQAADSYRQLEHERRALDTDHPDVQRAPHPRILRRLRGDEDPNPRP